MVVSSKVGIRTSGVHGNTWYALADIKSGEEVWHAGDSKRPHTDVKLTPLQIAALTPQKRDLFMSLAYQCDDDLYIGYDPEREPIQSELEENYINHSCDGNIWYEGDNRLVASRDIRAGEELCYDYVMTESQPDWELVCDRCCCGAKTCRGKITGNDWMRPELIEKYMEHSLEYMKKKMVQYKAQHLQQQKGGHEVKAHNTNGNGKAVDSPARKRKAEAPAGEEAVGEQPTRRSSRTPKKPAQATEDSHQQQHQAKKHKNGTANGHAEQTS